MSRENEGRVILSGSLLFDELVHVGGMATSAGYDALPAENGIGQWVIPGTSVIGVLRSWMNDRTSGDTDESELVQNVFGDHDGTRGAARLKVDDVVLENASVVLVDGVGINRFTGAAADSIKFDRLALQVDTHVPFRLTCEFGDQLSQATAEKFVREVASGLHHGQLRVGGSTARGFGCIRLVGRKGEGTPKMGTQLSNRAGVLDRLNKKERTEPIKDLVAESDANVNIEIVLESLTSTFSKSNVDGTAIDTLPRVEVRRGKPVLVIGATSVKGVLRSEAERILRTIHKTDISMDDPHLEQVMLPLVNELFGYAKIGDEGAVDQAHENEAKHYVSGSRAAIAFTDLLGDLNCTPEQWNSIYRLATGLTSKSNDDRQKILKTIGEAKLNWLVTDHVAIDRWTGGAAEGKLFSVLEPHGVTWRPLKLSLNQTQLSSMSSRNGEPINPLSGLAVLLLTLQALDDGSIGLGWGTTRGHGSVRVSHIKISGIPNHKELRIERTRHGLGSLIQDIELEAPSLVEELRQAWKSEVAK